MVLMEKPRWRQALPNNANLRPPMKNKTLATWLAFLGGPLGLHRFYLHGFGDCSAGCCRW